MSLFSSCGNSNLVWIGNIPYDASEEDLEQLLSTVGPVASIR
jgi:RNA recognition motif-containing protein